MHEENSFITLTYNDQHIPDGFDLDYTDFQKFMKRLRKKFHPKKVRFFACGEYGETFTRPHFHACLFGISFNDRLYFKTTKAGAKIYTSKTLDRLWTDSSGNPIGYATVGNVDFESAAYVARYTFKKELGRDGKSHYQFIDPETGEVHDRQPEFVRMSLGGRGGQGGIGTPFYEKYKADIFPRDICVIQGKEMKPPKFYYKKLKESGDLCFDEIQYNRELKSRRYAEDSTPERLEVREKVLTAKSSLYGRVIK